MLSKRTVFFVSLLSFSSGLCWDSLSWASSQKSSSLNFEFPIEETSKQALQAISQLTNYAKLLQNQSKRYERRQLSLQSKPFLLEVPYNDSLEKSEQQISQLKKELEGFKLVLKKTQAEKVGLVKKLEELQAIQTNSQKKDDKSSKLQQQLKEQKKKNAQLLEQIDKLKVSLDKKDQQYQKQISVAEKQVKDLNQQIAKQQEDLRKKDEELMEAALRSPEIKLSKEITELRNEALSLKKEKAKLTEFFQERTQALTENLSKLEKLQKENADLRAIHLNLASDQGDFLLTLQAKLKKNFSSVNEVSNAPSEESTTESEKKSFFTETLHKIDLEARKSFVHMVANYSQIPCSHFKEFIKTFTSEEKLEEFMKATNSKDRLALFKKGFKKKAFGLENYPVALDRGFSEASRDIPPSTNSYTVKLEVDNTSISFNPECNALVIHASDLMKQIEEQVKTEKASVNDEKGDKK